MPNVRTSNCGADYDFATKHADRIKSSPGGVAISETPEIKRYRTAWESLKKLFGY